MKPYYQDSAVTIYHGDCAEIVPSLGKFDLLLTDPPYGIGINKSNRLSVSRGFGAETWDDSAPCEELIGIIRGTAETQIIWGGNYFPLPPTKCFLVWDKINDGRDFADAELAWTNLPKVARIHRQRPQNMDGGKQHPTQKPLALVMWCMSLAGEFQTVLDPFAGSGTTGRAAKDLGKQCVLIEREERYCEIAAKRMAQEVFNF